MVVKAVVFDLDNTLYEYDSTNERAMEHVCKWMCDKAGVSRGRFMEAFNWARTQTKECMRDCASRHNRMIYFQKTSERLGLKPAVYSIGLYEDYWGYMLENMRLAEGAAEIMKQLRDSGIKIAVCTDLTAHIQHRKLQKLRIAEYVDVLVTSEEADAEKPDIRIFKMVLDKLCAEPDEVLYVGDSYEKDVMGAVNAGMHPVWYNPNGEKVNGVEVSNIPEIAEIGQLAGYIYTERQA